MKIRNRAPFYLTHEIDETKHYLNKQPRSDLGQSAILSIEAIVVGIKGKVVQIKEPQPVALADVGMATDGVVLIGNPHNQDHVEGRGRVVEEFRHDRFHSYNDTELMFLV